MSKKGIDISHYQKGLDLAEAKAAGVEFAIIKAGESTFTDSEYKTHIANAKANGISYGFYWYSRAFSTVDAKNEAAACLAAIKDYNPTYPIFYDMEDKDQIDKLARGQRTDIICAFCEEIKKAGYTAGVYLNPSWIENYVDKSRIIGNYELWLAHWTEDPNRPTKYDYGQVMWQWGLDHIGKFDVDGDLCFKDYAEKPQKETPVVDDTTNKEEKMIPIDSVVDFAGGTQYTASESDEGYPAKAGKVRITLTAKGAKHPYHAVSEDGSGVYGWVNSDTLSLYDSETDTKKYKAGAKITLKNADLYVAAGAKEAIRKISGTFYLYDGKDIDGYFRICPSIANVGKTPVAANVTGWIKI